MCFTFRFDSIELVFFWCLATLSSLSVGLGLVGGAVQFCFRCWFSDEEMNAVTVSVA